jgi:hypothetical protein
MARYRLNWVDNQRNRSRIELLEGSLSLNINEREPAAEPRVRVIPPNHYLTLEAYFRQHLSDHLLLVHRVDTLHAHRGGHLGHGKDINYFDLKAIIVEFSQHHTHHLKWDSKTT